MKKVVLASFTLLALLSFQANASVIEKGRILKQKITGSKHIKISFEENKKPTAKLKLTNEYISTFATAFPTQGKPDVPVTISDVITGSHLYNQTDTAQTYSTSVQLCVFLSEGDAECGIYEEEIELQPGGYRMIDVIPHLTLTLPNEGEYKVMAISVSSDAGYDHYSASNSTSKLVIHS